MYTIRVVGFQAIVDQTIEVDGLTVLTGPSDKGKSIMVRAIDAALNGMMGTFFINDGLPRAAVKIEDSNNVPTPMSVTWRKSRETDPLKPNLVHVNGLSHTKVTRAHSHLVEELGFPKPEGLSLNIASEFDLPFLLFESPSLVSTVFQDVSGADRVSRAAQKARTDKGEQNTLATIRARDLQGAEEQVVELNYVPALTAKKRTLEKMLAELRLSAHSVKQFEEDIALLFELQPVELKAPPQEPTMLEVGTIEEYFRTAPVVLAKPPVEPQFLDEGLLKEVLLQLPSRCEAPPTEPVFCDETTLLDLMALQPTEFSSSGEMAEVEAELSKFKSCPVCGSTLDGHNRDHV